MLQDTIKIAFGTRYEHYVFVAIPLGLINTSVLFIDLMNRVFKPCPVQLVVVFIDNILMYSKSPGDHKEHLKIVLTT